MQRDDRSDPSAPRDASPVPDGGGGAAGDQQGERDEQRRSSETTDTTGDHAQRATTYVAEITGDASRPMRGIAAGEQTAGTIDDGRWRLDRKRPRRLQTVRLPWAAGIVLLALLAAAVPSLLVVSSTTSSESLSPALIDQHTAITGALAELVAPAVGGRDEQGVDQQEVEQLMAVAGLGEASLVRDDLSVVVGRELDTPGRVAAARAAGGSTGSTVITGERRQLIGFAPVDAGDGDLVLVLRREVRAAVAGDLADEIRLRAYLFMLALCALAVALAVWWWRFLIRPLDALLDVAERLVADQTATPVEFSRDDEIGRVADALEQLRQRLEARDV